MNGRTVARILLLVVIVVGGASLAIGAYNAGVTAGLAQSGQIVVAPGGYPVSPTPYVGWGWGWGGGPGFGFFGFLGGLLFLFLLIGLVRAAVGGSRRGWAGPGSMGGPGGWRSDAWEQRVRETHAALHRESGDRSSELSRT